MDNYLNIPENTPQDLGIQKLMILRLFSIDYKHRETELIKHKVKITKKLIKKRNNYLRCLYKIPRVFNLSFPALKNIDTLRNPFILYPTLSEKVYIDFNILLLDNTIIDKFNKEKIIIFHPRIKEVDMLNYLKTHNLPLVKCRTTTKFKKDFETILFKEWTLKTKQIKKLWFLQKHLFVFYEKNKYCKISFKTNN